MKKTIYLLTRGDEDSGLQVIRAYDTEKDAKQSLLALAKSDGEGSLEINWITKTSYQVIDPKDPDRNILDNAGIHECTLEQSEEPELKAKKRYLVVRIGEQTDLHIVNACETEAEAAKLLKELCAQDSAKYNNPYVHCLESMSYRVFANSRCNKELAAAFILPETVPVYENTADRTVYLLVTDNTSGSDVISVFDTKEAALTALKDKAANDAGKQECRMVVWVKPTQYNLLTSKEFGHMSVTTVTIIERTLHVGVDV